MYNNRDSELVQIGYSFFKYRKLIAPADESSCFRVYALQSQFDPDRLDFLDFCQKLKYFRIQAVRPGGDGKKPDIRIGNCLQKNAPEIFCGCIGVGKSLKVSDKRMDRAFFLKRFLPLTKLIGAGKGGAAGKITGAGGTAENAAAGAGSDSSSRRTK